jgi:hypothetical protein
VPQIALAQISEVSAVARNSARRRARFSSRASAQYSRRAKLVSRAIPLCTTTALLICTVIAVLFLSAFVRFDTSIPVAVLFIAAMTTFFFGLLWFLREIFLATASLRFRTK